MLSIQYIINDRTLSI